VNEAVRHVVCPHCDSVNRLPLARNARTAKCGKCHKPLFTGQPLPASTASFLKQIERNDIPVVADSGRTGAAPAMPWRPPTPASPPTWNRRCAS
jgi:thioredoxin 2